MTTKNKGEKGEISAIVKCLENKDNIDWCCEKFGKMGTAGIEIIDPSTRQPITGIENIKKANSTVKADVIIGFRNTNTKKGVSIKYFHKSNPSIINTTTRSKFVNNPKLQKTLPSMDKLIGCYLNDPVNLAKNKSECDRQLCSYVLSKDEKQDIAAAIAYFTFDGSGKGDSSVPATAVMEMVHKTKQITYTDCPSEEEKVKYVLKNWDRYILSVRGHKLQKNGKLRTNGVSKYGATDDDMLWSCYYKNESKDYIRCALHIRIKKALKKRN